MTTMQNLQAKSRIAAGKSASRRLRAAGSVPAIAYGKGMESIAISVTPKEVLSILRSERGQNSVIQMKVEGGKDALVMIKEFSHHPVSRELTHVDFVQVKLDQPVTVEVPFSTVGKAAGVVKGGVLRQVFRKLPVTCLPNLIPLKIEADVTALDLNQAIPTRELKLPEGVSVAMPAELTLVAVVAPEKDRAEDAAAAAAPGAAPAAGAKDAKAPAAGAKDAKAPAAPAKDAKKK
jgi:large subunit ribosomal protein L25